MGSQASWICHRSKLDNHSFHKVWNIKTECNCEILLKAAWRIFPVFPWYNYLLVLVCHFWSVEWARLSLSLCDNLWKGVDKGWVWVVEVVLWSRKMNHYITWRVSKSCLFVYRLTFVQNYMKSSGILEMTVEEFFVNPSFDRQRGGLLVFFSPHIVHFVQWFIKK